MFSFIKKSYTKEQRHDVSSSMIMNIRMFSCKKHKQIYNLENGYKSIK